MKKSFIIYSFFLVLLTIIGCQNKSDSTPDVQEKDSIVEVKPEGQANSFEKELSLQGVTFSIKASGDHLNIQPSGLEISNEMISKIFNGKVTGAQIEDLNSDGSPDLFIFTSEGDNKFGNVIAFSVNNMKSVSEINFPKTADNKEINTGYNGQDEFTIIENSLARQFPVFNPDGTPSGKTRQIVYKLVAGEAAPQLEVKNISEY